MKKVKLTRGRVELLVVIILLFCSLSVFTLDFKSKATLIYDKGKITYTGSVVNHRMDGQGKLIYENGDTYKGSFVNGAFNGQGTFTSSIGWTYVGEFKNGQPDGKGTLTAKNGKVYRGNFKQGIYQK